MEYIFETERLRIRKFKIEDAIYFYVDCVNHGHLPYVLAAELKETGELIGDTGVNEIEGTDTHRVVFWVYREKMCSHTQKSLQNLFTALTALLKMLRYSFVLHKP